MRCLQVLDGGEVVEYDEPYSLLQRRHGAFASMVDSNKIQESESLRDLAMKVRVPTIGKSREKVGNFIMAFPDREKVGKIAS